MIQYFVLLLIFCFLSVAEARLKNPVILVHGVSLGGSQLVVGPLDLGAYFQGVENFLTDQEIEVGIPHLPSNASIGERAVVLQKYLKQNFKDRRVNIIGHSMGGLDARFLVSILKYPFVSSITGIATPHRGSPLADWAHKQKENEGFWYWVMRLFGFDLSHRRFLEELRPEHMQKKFNPWVRDMKGVQYYSVEAWGEIWTWSLSPLLYFPNWFIRGESHPMSRERNDGVVPLSSQAWGKVLGRLKLDHLAQINHHTLRASQEKRSLAMYVMIIEALERDGL